LPPQLAAQLGKVKNVIITEPWRMSEAEPVTFSLKGAGSHRRFELAIPDLTPSSALWKATPGVVTLVLKDGSAITMRLRLHRMVADTTAFDRAQIVQQIETQKRIQEFFAHERASDADFLSHAKDPNYRPDGYTNLNQLRDQLAGAGRDAENAAAKVAGRRRELSAAFAAADLQQREWAELIMRSDAPPDLADQILAMMLLSNKVAELKAAPHDPALEVIPAIKAQHEADAAALVKAQADLVAIEAQVRTRIKALGLMDTCLARFELSTHPELADSDRFEALLRRATWTASLKADFEGLAQRELERALDGAKFGIASANDEVTRSQTRQRELEAQLRNRHHNLRRIDLDAP
jgi:hypothetical protein